MIFGGVKKEEKSVCESDYEWRTQIYWTMELCVNNGQLRWHTPIRWSHANCLVQEQNGCIVTLQTSKVQQPNLNILIAITPRPPLSHCH